MIINKLTKEVAKQNKPAGLSLLSVSGFFFIGVMALILLSVFFSMSDIERDKVLPKVNNGQLDLSNFSLDTSYTIPLAGRWQIYWQELLNPAQIAQRGDSGQTLAVPGSWVNNSINGEGLPSKGFATYHTTVTLSEVYPQLGLFVPSIGTAFALYINDELLVSGGNVSSSAELSSPEYNPGVYTFAPNAKQFTITVQVSNHEYYWGGLWHAPRLGSPKSLHEAQYRSMIQTTFIVGIFFTICVFNLIQFTLRPENIQPLLITSIAFLLGLREVESSHVLSIAQVIDIPFEVGLRINFISYYLTVLPVVLYFYVNAKKDANRFAIYFMCGVSITMTLLVLFSSPFTFSSWVTVFQNFTFVAIAYVLYVLVIGLVRQRIHGNILFFGTVLLFSLVVHDLLLSMDMINSVSLANFGLLAFVMCQNYVTYLHFTNTSNQNILLNNALADKNQSLEVLSNTLEKQVKARTEDLADANTKLAQLVNEDPLTCLLNRRGLMQHIQAAKEQFVQANTPFCILLLDFDHFKRLNDTLGHDIGDIVLESGGVIMKSIIEDKGVVARWGGEEFFILVNNAQINVARKLAEAVRKEITFRLTQEINSLVTVTIGVSQFSHGQSIDQCIKRADEALFEGKKNGRNQVVLAATRDEELSVN